MPYSSSLSDREWKIIKPLLPKKKKTRPLSNPKYETRQKTRLTITINENWIERVTTRQAKAYSGRGDVYADLQDYQKALADYNKAIELRRVIN